MIRLMIVKLIVVNPHRETVSQLVAPIPYMPQELLEIFSLRLAGGSALINVTGALLISHRIALSSRQYCKVVCTAL